MEVQRTKTGMIKRKSAIVDSNLGFRKINIGDRDIPGIVIQMHILDDLPFRYI